MLMWSSQEASFSSFSCLPVTRGVSKLPHNCVKKLGKSWCWPILQSTNFYPLAEVQLLMLSKHFLLDLNSDSYFWRRMCKQWQALRLDDDGNEGKITNPRSKMKRSQAKQSQSRVNLADEKRERRKNSTNSNYPVLAQPRALHFCQRLTIICYWSSLTSSRFQAQENQVSRKQIKCQNGDTYFCLLSLLGLWISWAGLNSINFTLIIILVLYIYGSKPELAALFPVS